MTMSPEAALTPAFSVAALPPGSSPQTNRTAFRPGAELSIGCHRCPRSRATITSNCAGALVACRQSSTRAHTLAGSSRVATTIETDPKGGSRAGADVYRPTTHDSCRRQCSEDVRVDDVVDVGEVPRLLTVAV